MVLISLLPSASMVFLASSCSLGDRGERLAVSRGNSCVSHCVCPSTEVSKAIYLLGVVGSGGEQEDRAPKLAAWVTAGCSHARSPAAAVVVGHHEEQGLRRRILNELGHGPGVICQVNANQF